VFVRFSVISIFLNTGLEQPALYDKDGDLVAML
jgi:hypothetical protein